MSIRIFHFSRPERPLAEGETWVPATEKTYPTGTGKTFAEAEAEQPGWVYSHEGLVIETRERNGSWDSDFYATVFDPETGGFESVTYASTAYWTYANGATVDAPHALLEYYQDVQREAHERYLADLEALEALVPRKGRVVKAVRTFKVKGVPFAKGTEFEVFWYGETGYGKRVGLVAVESREKVFTAAKNVEAIVGMEVAV